MQSGSLYSLVTCGLQIRFAVSIGFVLPRCFSPISTSSLVAAEAAKALGITSLPSLNLTRFGWGVGVM